MARRGASELAILKEAEDEAGRIISAARDERKARMRQAVAEAQREIDEYKAMREVKLRQSNPEAEALISRVRRVTVETDQRLGALEAEYQRNKELVAGMLLQIVLSIDNPYTPK